MLQSAQEELDRFTQLGSSYSRDTQKHVGATVLWVVKWSIVCVCVCVCVRVCVCVCL